MSFPGAPSASGPDRVLPGTRAGQDGGFTLLEVMIVGVVIAILAMVAYPAYLDSIRKSRRSEGVNALMQIQLAQERWRSNQASYAASVSNAADGTPPGLALPDVTPGGYYALSIEAPSATGYEATATGRTGTTQAADAACRTLRVKLEDGNLTYAGCGGTECDSFSASHPCWAR
jgi:type IV pilus assembly protein PilE